MKTASCSSKKILLTYARSPLTLDLARQLHSAGHQILVADSIKNHISKFSNAVSKTFVVPSPSYESAKYLDALVQIVKEESIDLLVPIFEETARIAKHKEHFPKSCVIFSPSFELFHELHHKWLFQCLLKKIGLPAIFSILLSNSKELDALNLKIPYVLKACYSRASQSIQKLYPGQPLPKIPVSSENPLIAQEWLEGNKYCSYSVCHQGKIFAHSLYPVQYAIGGRSCVMFESIHHPGIYEWISVFARATSYTGQIAFDFIETEKKEIYAIECNPRATSGLHLFNHKDHLEQAFFAKNSTPLFAETGVKKQIAMGMMLYGWKKSALPNNRLSTFLKDFWNIQDVVYQPGDIKPFLFKPFIFALLFKQALKSKLSLPEYFMHDHNWDGEKIS